MQFLPLNGNAKSGPSRWLPVESFRQPSVKKRVERRRAAFTGMIEIGALA